MIRESTAILGCKSTFTMTADNRLRLRRKHSNRVISVALGAVGFLTSSHFQTRQSRRSLREISTDLAINNSWAYLITRSRNSIVKRLARLAEFAFLQVGISRSQLCFIASLLFSLSSQSPPKPNDSPVASSFLSPVVSCTWLLAVRPAPFVGAPSVGW